MAGSWEELAGLPAALTAAERARLRHRRCGLCRRIAYCLPGLACKCGGHFDRPPAWPTGIAPRLGDGSVEPLPLPE